MPSRSGEFHPEPLTDPDLILSHHPARATARRLPPSIEHWVPPAAGWTRHRLTRINVDGLLPSLHGHYPASPLLQSSPPLAGASVFQPRGWSHLCFFPWHRRLGSHVPYQSLIELRAAYMPDVYERWRWALRVRQSGVDLKPPQTAVVKIHGGERCGKTGTRFRQARLREASASELPATCRKRSDGAKIGG